jgi:hypothetical protein
MEKEYKVGEKVKITSDLSKLKLIKTGYTEDMRKLLGKVVTISNVKETSLNAWKYTYTYTLVEDVHKWNWSSEVFEIVEEKEYKQLKDVLKTRGI